MHVVRPRTCRPSYLQMAARLILVNERFHLSAQDVKNRELLPYRFAHLLQMMKTVAKSISAPNDATSQYICALIV